MDHVAKTESTMQASRAVGAALNRTLVTGVIGSDTHIVGNRILSMTLEKAGFHVIALGALTPSADFIKAAISSVYEISEPLERLAPQPTHSLWPAPRDPRR